MRPLSSAHSGRRRRRSGLSAHGILSLPVILRSGCYPARDYGALTPELLGHTSPTLYCSEFHEMLGTDIFAVRTSLKLSWQWRSSYLHIINRPLVAVDVRPRCHRNGACYRTGSHHDSRIGLHSHAFVGSPAPGHLLLAFAMQRDPQENRHYPRMSHSALDGRSTRCPWSSRRASL